MEILQRLGIPFEAIASQRMQRQAEEKTASFALDPSEADDYFGKHLVPVLCGGGEGIEDLLERYVAACKAYAKKTSGPQQEYWLEEADVWSLMHNVLPETDTNVEEEDALSIQSRVQAKIRASPMMCHLIRIKEWLESSAPAFIPAELRKRPVPISTSSSCHLDPDSQAVKDPLDAAWEEAHLQSLWSYVRRGRLQEAIACCFECKEPWRAGILSGGFLPHDPLLDGEDGQMAGNPARSLWSRTVKALVRDESLGQTERALYGALVGDVQAMQPLCRDWKDVLWSAVISVIEAFIQSTVGSTSALVDEGSLESAMQTIEQRFPETKSNPLFALMRSLILRSDWSQAAFPRLQNTDSRLCAIGAIILPVTRQSPVHKDVLLHAYLMRLLQSGHTKHWIFYASKLAGKEIQGDALLAFWQHISGLPKDSKWALMREAMSYEIPLWPSIERLSGSILDFLLFAEDESLKPLLAEYAASALRQLLLRSEWASARALLAQLPLPSFSTLVDDASVGTFARELFYYDHLCKVMSLYESWSGAYAASISGDVQAKQALIQLSRSFAEKAIQLLDADWLGDVERAETRYGSSEQREVELASLRSTSICDLALLLLAIFAMKEQLIALENVTFFFTLLADERLELWKEFKAEGKLNVLIDRLDRLQTLSECEVERQAALAFLQQC